MDYQIVHAVEGRIRIRIPLLAEGVEYASKLQKQIESLNFVTNVRINPLAESIIVIYRYKSVSCALMQTHLQEAIAQIASPQPPSTPPAPEPVVVEEKSPGASTGVASSSRREIPWGFNRSCTRVVCL